MSDLDTLAAWEQWLCPANGTEHDDDSNADDDNCMMGTGGYYQAAN